jgi:hypothetical protein
MKPAFDLTSVRLLLRQGIAKGHWTLEDLDTPSMGFQENAKQFRLHNPKYEQYEYRNPLRDPEPLEAVQLSDPRDFTPTTGATPAQALDLPLTTEDPLDDLPF